MCYKSEGFGKKFRNDTTLKISTETKATVLIFVFKYSVEIQYDSLLNSVNIYRFFLSVYFHRNEVFLSILNYLNILKNSL